MAKPQDGRQARWQRHNEERRRAILEAATEVIADGAPGEEFHVQQIAERAGLNRTVVYRHFADRADLDDAIRAHILDALIADLLPTVSLDGTVNEIIRRIVGTYVEWAAAHPALHAFAAEGGTSLEQGTDRVAVALFDVLDLAINLLEVEVGDDDRALLDPLVHGLVGAVFGTVRRWVSRAPRQPVADVLIEMLARSGWALIDVHARRLGLVLDPDLPLADLLPAAPA